MTNEVYNIEYRQYRGRTIATGVVPTIGIISGVGDTEEEAVENMLYRFHNTYHSQ